jgi:hypothetical protein
MGIRRRGASRHDRSDQPVQQIDAKSMLTVPVVVERDASVIMSVIVSAVAAGAATAAVFATHGLSRTEPFC